LVRSGPRRVLRCAQDDTDAVELARVEDTLGPADHQTHRRYPFDVPPDCSRLHIEVRYQPKYLAVADSRALAEWAINSQATALARRVDAPELIRAWQHAWRVPTVAPGRTSPERRVANLLTVSLDDAAGTYRGAGHRQAAEQRFELGPSSASAGLVAGPLPAGRWWLTLSVHTLVSPRCSVSIQIGAEIASSSPSAARSTA
jgi:hypothetical protein